jgi:hypothetical protein
VSELPKGPFLSSPLSTEAKSGEGTHFRPIKDAEADYIRELQDKVRKYKADIVLADRVLAVKNSPGFQEFVIAVRRKRDLTRRDMECHYGEDSVLRILQGRTQALTSMLSIVEDTEKLRATLAQELARLEELQQATVRQDDKRVRPAIGG